jgi:hypothetical protein
MKRWNLNEIKGVIPALVTPFNEDESLSEEKVRHLVDYLIDVGVNGFYLTGSTGEGFLMDTWERQKVVEIAIDQVKDRLPVIVHVGAISTKTTVELARHAYECGASAISSVPPFYYRFSFDEIYDYYKDISDAVPLPLIIYNIAATTGTDSPVKAASSTFRLDTSMSLISAGTKSPVSNTTTSPGTKFLASITSGLPSLTTFAWGADILLRADKDSSALFSCIIPNAALRSTMARIIIASLISPNNPDIIAAMISITTIKSLNCSINILQTDLRSFCSNSFGPYF